MESDSKPPPAQEQEGSGCRVPANVEGPPTSHKRKRALMEGGGSAGCAANRRYNRFDTLGKDCRVRVLKFLGPGDLAEAAAVCKQFLDDCRDESLPQERTAVIRIPPNCRHQDRIKRLGTRLLAMAGATLPDGRRKFSKFCRLRIIDPNHDFGKNGSWSPPAGATIPEIAALDWSREEPVPPWISERCSDTGEQRGLLRMLPNLREVDFSRARTACKYALYEPSFRLLEKVTWHGSWGCLQSDGFQLVNCPILRELHMDGSCFEGVHRRLFLDLRDRLERVSIKSASSRRLLSTRAPEPIPQSALVDFVRNAPNLRWFRSDLTPENVARLQGERPDVAFAS
jgi:hypothetical protein